jgi:HAD superfamily hydrolase (TIGR01549 family)
MIKAIIFDFDGTLVKTKDFVKRHILQIITTQREVAKDEESNLENKLDEILNRNTPFGKIFEEIFSEEWEEYLEKYRATAMETKYKPREDMIGFVEELKEKGIKFYILSNRSNKLKERLEQAGYNEADFEIYSAPDGHRKPDKESYQEVLRAVEKDDFRIKEVLVLGDHIHDYLGLPDEWKDRFRALPDNELQKDAFEGLVEFPKKYICENVAQLRDSIKGEFNSEVSNIS